MKKSFLGEFERNSLIVFSISMLSNVINYLYQIIMGNLLSPSDYGLVNTLLSLSIVAGVPSGIFSALTATYTAKYHAQGDTGSIAEFMRKMFRVSMLFSMLFFFVSIPVSIPVASILQIVYI